MDAIHVIQDLYPGKLEEIYESGEVNPNGMLKAIAAKRRCLGENGEADTRKAAELFLTELRHARLGRLSLEHVKDEDSEENAE
jgi:ribosome biogenesis GTPase A